MKTIKVILKNLSKIRKVLPYVGMLSELIKRIKQARDNEGPENPKGKITVDEGMVIAQWFFTVLCKAMGIEIYDIGARAVGSLDREGPAEKGEKSECGSEGSTSTE